MFQDNPLLAQLKQQIKENIPKKEGTIKATDKGFGFLEVDSKHSYFIPPPYMKKCLHGDKVVALIRTENNKEVAEPDELVEHHMSRFIARVKMFKGRLNVVADIPQLKRLSLKAKAKKGLNPEFLSDGDWVVAHLTKHPLNGDNGFFVEISEKIADANDKIAPWWVTLAENDLPNCEPEGLTEWHTNDDDDLTRVDMLDIPFVTIDGASTKDMDDALYAKRKENNDIELTIAIADPTAYISVDSDMDKVARERGFTIYLPGRNIPMLPRDLADNLCSLLEGETRPALCCRVTVGQDGALADDIQFFAANIKSHARLTYQDVSDWLEEDSNSQWQPTEAIAEVINSLHQFATSRSAWREQNAVVFPDKPDYRFELSDENDVIAIHSEQRRSANRLVEEAMITANICAGLTLQNSLGTGIFNTHSGFKTDRLKDVIELVNPDQTQPFTLDSITTLDGFSALRRWLNTQDTSYLDNRIRKYQTYSEITNHSAPHFAMGLESYATWTSPIRKYGDMINHRLLKAHILNKPPVQTPDELVGAELSSHRKHHKIAERKVADWLYARTLLAAVSNKTVFNGEIFDINRAGLRVQLIENGATAFVPASLLVDNKERIECSSETGTVSIDNDHVYQLGDVIELILSDVNIENRNIVAKPTAVFTDVSRDSEDS
ncbi:exoribonuclease 2 [Vibrio sp. MACH09]|uniref:exoribonuclease II n=1 Tax=Vibrio sp. MACH09 TaxID=3025122 RepID=UPI002790C9E5|nr:exoribonuclease II [Vibrio sp. MACH09]GLO63819.1 exoribonuclease 2 [Vibrio sp. MACH09]